MSRTPSRHPQDVWENRGLPAPKGSGGSGIQQCGDGSSVLETNSFSVNQNMTPVELEIRLFNWNTPRSPNLEWNSSYMGGLMTAFPNMGDLRHRCKDLLKDTHVILLVNSQELIFIFFFEILRAA